MRYVLVGLLIFIAMPLAAQQVLFPGVLAASTATTSLKDSLVEYWTMDETGNNNRMGSTAMKDTLFPSTATMFDTAGVINKAAQFYNNMSTPLYTLHESVTGSPKTTSGDFDQTIAFWVRLDTIQTAVQLVTKGRGYTASTSWAVQIATPFSNRAFRFYLSNGTSTKTIDYTDTVVVVNHPYFVMAWFKHGASDSLFIQVNNGSIKADVTTVAPQAYTADAGYAELKFGATENSYNFRGFFDEAFYSKRVYTPAERTQLYNSGSGLSYTSW